MAGATGHTEQLGWTLSAAFQAPFIETHNTGNLTLLARPEMGRKILQPESFRASTIRLKGISLLCGPADKPSLKHKGVFYFCAQRQVPAPTLLFPGLPVSPSNPALLSPEKCVPISCCLSDISNVMGLETTHKTKTECWMSDEEIK